MVVLLNIRTDFPCFGSKSSNIHAIYHERLAVLVNDKKGRLSALLSTPAKIGLAKS
jgi:hypothetical protein